MLYDRLFLNRFFFIITLLLWTNSTLAFSGGGGGRTPPGRVGTTYKAGVDSIGIHFGGDTNVPCPEHSTKIDGLCFCDDGYTPDGQGACVADMCIDFEPTDCMVDCNPITGEKGYVSLCHDGAYYCNKEHECVDPCEGKATNDCVSTWTPVGKTCEPTYVEAGTPVNHKICDGQGGWTCETGYLNENNACVKDACYNLPENPCVLSCTSSGGIASFTYAELCNNGTYYCNANHECTNPCDGAEYTACETCTPVAGKPQITTKEDGALCKDPNNKYNYLCTDGVCNNPCTEESTACITHTPNAGACQTTINENADCSTDTEHRICNLKGECVLYTDCALYGEECGSCTPAQGFTPDGGNQCSNDKPYCINGYCSPCNTGSFWYWKGYCMTCTQSDNYWTSTKEIGPINKHNCLGTMFYEPSTYVMSCCTGHREVQAAADEVSCKACENRCYANDGKCRKTNQVYQREADGSCSCNNGYYWYVTHNLCKQCENVNNWWTTTAAYKHNCLGSMYYLKSRMYGCINTRTDEGYHNDPGADELSCKACENRCFKVEDNSCQIVGTTYDKDDNGNCVAK